jgi:hypothetical protein
MAAKTAHGLLSVHRQKIPDKLRSRHLKRTKESREED